MFDREEREEREDWEERPARRVRRSKNLPRPFRCDYRMQHSPKKPTVYSVGVPKLGEIISTKEYGPAKVVEVFWWSDWHADVLLRRIETEKMTIPQRLAVKDAVKKPALKKPYIKKPSVKKPYVKKDVKQ